MSARELLQKATGLNLTEAEVQRAVGRRMRVLELDDGAAYLRLLRLRQPELQALTELVVVPESWMFRDAEAFNYASAFVQKRLKSSPGNLASPARPVRIASIPCAGGEEPYSMAMALHGAGVAPSAYSIDGFDLSDVSIARARRGRYTRNAFRGNGKLEFRERYFTLADGEYQIAEELRRQVCFSQGNLLAPDFAARPGWYDVIFCRNLLIYFDEPTTAQAIAALSTLLADDGVLLAGYAEVPSFCRHGFAALREPGAFALVKAGSTLAPPERRALQAAPVTERRAAPLRPGAARPPAGHAAPVRPASAPAPIHSPGAPIAVPAAAHADTLARARSLADIDDYDAAAQACRAVLATAPDSADAWFILGMVSECRKQSFEAGQHWRRCIYLQPDHYEALCHLALLAGQEGDAQQAAAFKRRAARIYERLQGQAPKGRR